MNDDPFGFVETPEPLADWLAGELWVQAPEEGDRILYPGAGRGELAAAVHRRCSVRGRTAPDAVFVERDPDHIETLENRFVGPDATHNHGVPETSSDSRSYHRALRSVPEDAPVATDVTIHNTDFLRDPPEGTFDYIISNPPYTAYNKVAEEDREFYNEAFQTTTGRYGLYVPFVEQMLELLAPNGILVFLAPVQWLNAKSSKAFRNRIRHEAPATPRLVPDCAFPDHAVRTTVNLVGRDDAEWTGPATNPARTNLSPCCRTRGIDRLVERFGVPEDEHEDVIDEYLERDRGVSQLLNHFRTKERDELDDTPEDQQQPSLQSFA
jgi:predicted RNA methylase